MTKRARIKSVEDISSFAKSNEIALLLVVPVESDCFWVKTLDGHQICIPKGSDLVFEDGNVSIKEHEFCSIADRDLLGALVNKSELNDSELLDIADLLSNLLCQEVREISWTTDVDWSNEDEIRWRDSDDELWGPTPKEDIIKAATLLLEGDSSLAEEIFAAA